MSVQLPAVLRRERGVLVREDVREGGARDPAADGGARAGIGGGGIAEFSRSVRGTIHDFASDSHARAALRGGPGGWREAFIFMECL